VDYAFCCVNCLLQVGIIAAWYASIWAKSAIIWRGELLQRLGRKSVLYSLVRQLMVEKPECRTANSPGVWQSTGFFFAVTDGNGVEKPVRERSKGRVPESNNECVMGVTWIMLLVFLSI
jgi:hypothetical protein